MGEWRPGNGQPLRQRLLEHVWLTSNPARARRTAAAIHSTNAPATRGISGRAQRFNVRSWLIPERHGSSTRLMRCTVPTSVARLPQHSCWATREHNDDNCHPIETAPAVAKTSSGGRSENFRSRAKPTRSRDRVAGTASRLQPVMESVREEHTDIPRTARRCPQFAQVLATEKAANSDWGSTTIETFPVAD